MLDLWVVVGLGHLSEEDVLMRRASWILGSLAVCTIAACGGGNRQDTTAGTGSESGSMSDTSTMAPSTTPMDTAMTGTGTGTGMDTMSDTTTR